MTAVTRRLLELGMIREVETTPSRGGRPAVLLGLVGTAARAVGVKVAADHLTIVGVRLDGEVLGETTQPFDAAHPDALARLADALSPFCADTSGAPPLLGVGVGIPGVVADPEVGSVDAPILQWSSKPVGAELRSRLGQPVIVENDVNAVAVAERLYGNGRDLDCFLVVTIGSGVGSALVQDGVVFRGARGAAGEFGHVPVSVDGPLCRCGRRGCLEAMIGSAALVESARAAGAIEPGQGLEILTARAEAGLEAARDVFAQAGETLGRAIAVLANVLDPRQVLILGEGTSAWSLWEGTFLRTAEAHLTGRLAFTVDPWDDSRWAQGAAALVLAAPFDSRGTGGRESEKVLAKLAGEGRST